MIGAYFTDPVEAEARSLLAFSTRIGMHFLVTDPPDDMDRAAVTIRVADIVLGPPEKD